MPYTKRGWSSTTPLSVANLEAMDEGIYQATNTAEGSVPQSRTIAGFALSGNISKGDLAGALTQTITMAPQTVQSNSYAFVGKRLYRLVDNKWHVYECVNKTGPDENQYYHYTWTELSDNAIHFDNNTTSRESIESGESVMNIADESWCRAHADEIPNVLTVHSIAEAAVMDITFEILTDILLALSKLNLFCFGTPYSGTSDEGEEEEEEEAVE